MNERIKELAEQSGLEWVEMMQTWLANDAEIERFYEMAFEAGRMVGFKQDKALTELARIGQEIEQAEKQEPVANRSDCGHKEFMPLCQMCQAMGAQAHSYTAPPEVKNWQQIAEYRLKLMFDLAKRKEWVGLTELEVKHYNNRLSGSNVAQEIESKLRERNT